MRHLPRVALLLLVPVGLVFAATAAARFEPGLLRRSLDTDVEIDASAERVWSVLADFDAYPEWNPFIRAIVSWMWPPGWRRRLRPRPSRAC